MATQNSLPESIDEAVLRKVLAEYGYVNLPPDEVQRVGQIILERERQEMAAEEGPHANDDDTCNDDDNNDHGGDGDGDGEVVCQHQQQQRQQKEEGEVHARGAEVGPRYDHRDDDDDEDATEALDQMSFPSRSRQQRGGLAGGASYAYDYGGGSGGGEDEKAADHPLPQHSSFRKDLSSLEKAIPKKSPSPNDAEAGTPHFGFATAPIAVTSAKTANNKIGGGGKKGANNNKNKTTTANDFTAADAKKKGLTTKSGKSAKGRREGQKGDEAETLMEKAHRIVLEQQAKEAARREAEALRGVPPPPPPRSATLFANSKNKKISSDDSVEKRDGKKGKKEVGQGAMALSHRQHHDPFLLSSPSSPSAATKRRSASAANQQHKSSSSSPSSPPITRAHIHVTSNPHEIVNERGEYRHQQRFKPYAGLEERLAALEEHEQQLERQREALAEALASAHLPARHYAADSTPPPKAKAKGVGGGTYGTINVTPRTNINNSSNKAGLTPSGDGNNKEEQDGEGEENNEEGDGVFNRGAAQQRTITFIDTDKADADNKVGAGAEQSRRRRVGYTDIGAAHTPSRRDNDDDGDYDDGNRGDQHHPHHRPSTGGRKRTAPAASYLTGASPSSLAPSPYANITGGIKGRGSATLAHDETMNAIYQRNNGNNNNSNNPSRRSQSAAAVLASSFSDYASASPFASSAVAAAALGAPRGPFGDIRGADASLLPHPFLSRHASNVIYSYTDNVNYRSLLPAGGGIHRPAKRIATDVVAKGNATRAQWARDRFLTQKGRKEELWEIRRSMISLPPQ